MPDTPSTYLAFAGHTRFARGLLPEVAAAVRTRLDAGETAPVAVFHGSTGAPVDLDLRGTPQEVAASAAVRQEAEQTASTGRTGPGRPRLGVVGREVTLLPRHWDWLAAQPGGASVTLRKLVEAARKESQGPHAIRRAQDAAYRFMHALAGDLPGFEEATRALYAWDVERMRGLIEGWPPDVRDHTLALVEEGREAQPARP